MSPLDAAMLRLGHVTLALLHPRLAERAAAELDEGEEQRAAADVDRLAGMLAKAG